MSINVPTFKNPKGGFGGVSPPTMFQNPVVRNLPRQLPANINAVIPNRVKSRVAGMIIGRTMLRAVPVVGTAILVADLAQFLLPPVSQWFKKGSNTAPEGYVFNEAGGLTYPGFALTHNPGDDHSVVKHSTVSPSKTESRAAWQIDGLEVDFWSTKDGLFFGLQRWIWSHTIAFPTPGSTVIWPGSGPATYYPVAPTPTVRPRPRKRPRTAPIPRPLPRNLPQWPKTAPRPDLRPPKTPRITENLTPGVDIYPDGRVVHRPNTNTRPPRATKETKVSSKTTMGKVLTTILNWTSETAEFLDILFEAAGIEGGGLNERAYRFFEEKAYENIDWEELVFGVIANQIEDRVVGYTAGKVQKSFVDLNQSSFTIYGGTGFQS
jgi:hypothetical protein